MCGIVPLTLLGGTLEFGYWSWQDATLHLAFETVVSVILLHILFFSFHKVPFHLFVLSGQEESRDPDGYVLVRIHNLYLDDGGS